MRDEFLIRCVVALSMMAQLPQFQTRSGQRTSEAFSSAFLTNCRMMVLLYPPLTKAPASDIPAGGVSLPDSLVAGVELVASFARRSLVASLVLLVRRGGTDGGVPKDADSSSVRVRLRPTSELDRTVGIGRGVVILQVARAKARTA